MINTQKLAEAYDKDGFYALQLEVGDVCNQGCIYCYMNALPEEKNTLSDHDIEVILAGAKILGITAIEWLGGEPLLRDRIFDHMEQARDLGFRNNMWTGGLPLTRDDVVDNLVDLCQHGLISVHISSIDHAVYNMLHPGKRHATDLDKIMLGIRNVLDAGYRPEQMLNSVTFTGLQTANDMIRTIEYFETELGIATSLNVYHTYLRPEHARTDLERFIPTPADVAKVYKRWTEQSGKDHLPMNCVNKQYCSATLAVLCDGSITPCATIREEGAPNIHSGHSFIHLVEANRDHLIIKPLKEKVNLPASCQVCFMNDECWGCRSRAFAAGLGLLGRDPRCYRSRLTKEK